MMAKIQKVCDLHNAVHTLEFPYTYESRSIPIEKREPRRRVGGMAAEIIGTMRDEILEELIGDLREWKGLKSV